MTATGIKYGNFNKNFNNNNNVKALVVPLFSKKLFYQFHHCIHEFQVELENL